MAQCVIDVKRRCHKMTRRNSLSTAVTMGGVIPDKCTFCDEKATHWLLIKNWYGGTKSCFLCNKCRLKWVHNELDI